GVLDNNTFVRIAADHVRFAGDDAADGVVMAATVDNDALRVRLRRLSGLVEPDPAAFDHVAARSGARNFHTESAIARDPQPLTIWARTGFSIATDRVRN